MLDAKMALAVGWLSDSRRSKSRQPIGQQCLFRSRLVGYADAYVPNRAVEECKQKARPVGGLVRGKNSST